MQYRRAVVAKIQAADFDVALDFVGFGGGFGSVYDFRLLGENLVNARHGGGAALKDVDHPSECDHGPSQLHHVGVEGDELADVHVSLEHLATAQPQHEHDCEAEHGLERRPEHAHQSY